MKGIKEYMIENDH